ncbi:hypothetical protein A0H81_07367 [Grifola frondosa]|uniref:Uncharacterized protein n=1 Tax=Grifola frondosa TaxID=5627 RepID=A0A1C7M6P0_GRIFR|nr:hypothetical protein A0H81_07367 [Grifola frondosa]
MRKRGLVSLRIPLKIVARVLQDDMQSHSSSPSTSTLIPRVPIVAMAVTPNNNNGNTSFDGVRRSIRIRMPRRVPCVSVSVQSSVNSACDDISVSRSSRTRTKTSSSPVIGSTVLPTLSRATRANPAVVTTKLISLNPAKSGSGTIRSKSNHPLVPSPSETKSRKKTKPSATPSPSATAGTKRRRECDLPDHEFAPSSPTPDLRTPRQIRYSKRQRLLTSSSPLPRAPLTRRPQQLSSSAMFAMNALFFLPVLKAKAIASQSSLDVPDTVSLDHSHLGKLPQSADSDKHVHESVAQPASELEILSERAHIPTHEELYPIQVSSVSSSSPLSGDYSPAASALSHQEIGAASSIDTVQWHSTEESHYASSVHVAAPSPFETYPTGPSLNVTSLIVPHTNAANARPLYPLPEKPSRKAIRERKRDACDVNIWKIACQERIHTVIRRFGPNVFRAVLDKETQAFKRAPPPEFRLYTPATYSRAVDGDGDALMDIDSEELFTSDDEDEDEDDDLDLDEDEEVNLPGTGQLNAGAYFSGSQPQEDHLSGAPSPRPTGFSNRTEGQPMQAPPEPPAPTPGAAAPTAQLPVVELPNPLPQLPCLTSLRVSVEQFPILTPEGRSYMGRGTPIDRQRRMDWGEPMVACTLPALVPEHEHACQGARAPASHFNVNVNIGMHMGMGMDMYGGMPPPFAQYPEPAPSSPMLSAYPTPPMTFPTYTPSAPDCTAWLDPALRPPAPAMAIASSSFGPVPSPDCANTGAVASGSQSPRLRLAQQLPAVPPRRGRRVRRAAVRCGYQLGLPRANAGVAGEHAQSCPGLSRLEGGCACVG